MEKTKKDQFVIAYLPDIENNKMVIAHAKHLSKTLDKGLILLHICDPTYSSLTTAAAEEQLKELIDAPNINYCVIKGKTKNIIEELPTLLNGVVVVAEVDAKKRKSCPNNPKTIIKNFATCKIAWLTIQPDTPINYQQVALTIDFHRESKEKLVWASYFARFGNSKLHVLYKEYKDQGLHQKWYDNMLFLSKLYSNLNISFTPHILTGNSSSVDTDALEFMHQSNINLLVTVTTKEKDFIDQIIGAPEQRTIKNKEKIPILFLNPREDLYVLCD